MKVSPAAMGIVGTIVFATFLAILSVSLISYLPPTIGGMVRATNSLLLVEGLLLGITSLTERNRTKKVLGFVWILGLLASLIASIYYGFVSDAELGTPGANPASIAVNRIDLGSFLGISYLVDLGLFIFMMEVYFVAFVTPSEPQPAPSKPMSG